MNRNQEAIELAFYNINIYCPRVTVIKNCDFFDLFASTTDITSRFGIKVFDKQDDNATIVNEYVRFVASANPDTNIQLSQPIIVVFVDTNSGIITFSPILEWRYGSYRLYRYNNLQKVIWGKNSSSLLFATLDNAIRLLPSQMFSVLKKIIFTINNQKIEALYLRQLSSSYGMKEEVKKPDLEKYEHLLHEIPEVNYPSDDLDILILKTIKEKYLDATCYSSLVIFNTNIRDLQHYRGYVKTTNKMILFPSLSSIKSYISFQKSESLPQIDIEYYSLPAAGSNLACSESLSCEFEMQKLMNIKSSINSYKVLSTFLLK